ncbi:MAG TPA: general stress protein [Chloroflexota bacterium]|jgi:uncharacterized membrane protein
MADAPARDIVVGAFDTQEQAEHAVRRLIDAGVPATHISVVTKELEARRQVQGYVTTGDVARQTAGVGAWVGGLFGLLTGAAFLWVPGLGPLMILGPLVNTAIGALEGGAVGGLFGAIFGHFMERDHVLKYQTALQGGKLLVLVSGDRQELETARRVLGENSGQDVTLHQAA